MFPLELVLVGGEGILIPRALAGRCASEQEEEKR
jgi:hypothetical protein